MRNKEELIQQIRFGIYQLSAKNGQMDFEHICRHLTKLRICSNVIPATGPVQAGGDQGRDFETFHTYLHKNPIADTTFIGLASQKPVAFACSLEKNPTVKNGKIQSDVETIIASGTTVDRVYFFSSEDVPVAKRHKIQKWAIEKKKLELEILDGNAVAEMLADPDTFWIANKFLSISSDHYPRSLESEGWYTNILDEYKAKKHLRLTFEEFNDIKLALRHIYKSKVLIADLPFWISKIDVYISDALPNSMKRKAIYEKFVTTLIGLKDISGQEDDIRLYFSQLPEKFDTAELEDATVLLSLSNSSKKLCENNFTVKELEAWRIKLWNKLEEELKITKNTSKKCSILETQAYFLISIPDSKVSIEEIAKKHMKKLRSFLNLISDAVMYPLERFSDKLTKQISFFINWNLPTEELEEITEKVDDYLARPYPKSMKKIMPIVTFKKFYR